jgi:hypothetical protein
MTRQHAENGPTNAGSRAGANAEPELDDYARRQGQLLPQLPMVSEAHRHQYPPVPPKQQHVPHLMLDAKKPKWRHA